MTYTYPDGYGATEDQRIGVKGDTFASTRDGATYSLVFTEDRRQETFGKMVSACDFRTDNGRWPD